MSNLNTEPHTVIHMHSQTDPGNGNNEFNTAVQLKMNGIPAEQHFESRGLNMFIYDWLTGQDSVYCTDIPVPEDYITYLAQLGINIDPAKIINVPNEYGNLSLNAIHDPGLIPALGEHVNGSGAILATFTPYATEAHLLEHLREQGLQVTGEFSEQTIGLVNKGAQHVLLSQPILADLDGDGIAEKVNLRHNSELLFREKFEEETEILGGQNNLENFATYIKKHYGEKVFFKHAYGTAGEGMWTFDQIDEVYDVIQNSNLIVVEGFFENSTEHAVHFYIDPITHKASFIGSYDQLVKPTERGGFAHSGCAHPSHFPDKADLLEKISGPLGERLSTLGVTGYMCCDVLVNDQNQIHVMEINTRPGANLYALRLAQTVMETKFHSQTDPNFELHAGMPLEATSVTELFTRYPRLKTLCDAGNVILSNYGKILDGKWDIIFLDPVSAEGLNSIKKDFEEAIYASSSTFI